MKGLTHFMSGVALSTFFVPAVTMAASSKSGIPDASASFILLLGGLYGIMPDTLDFKVGQFFEKPDVEIDCNTNNPNPQKMAEQLGKAIEMAASEDRYIKAQFYPMRVGANLWRQYMIKFDGEKNEVIIVINEIVSTSQVPFMGTEPPEEKRIGRYKLKCDLVETHGRPSVVDILSGPQYGFKKVNDKVIIEFLPWHRTWSHSYILGLILALPVFLIAWYFKFANWHLYGIVAFLGFFIHITEDLTGHMGGSLIWPFDKTRYDGLCMFKASDPMMNFSVDYACFVIILNNLDRILTHVITLSPFAYYLWFLVLPLAIYVTIFKMFSVKTKRSGISSAENALTIAEKQDIKNEELMFESN